MARKIQHQSKPLVALSPENVARTLGARRFSSNIMVCAKRESDYIREYVSYCAGSRSDWITVEGPNLIVIRVGCGSKIFQKVLRVQGRGNGVKFSRCLVQVKAIGKIIGQGVGVTQRFQTV